MTCRPCNPVMVKYSAMNVLVDGQSPVSNLWAYSNPLMIRKPTPHRIVMPIYILYLPRSFFFKDAQLMTIVKLEMIRTMVLIVARGTFRNAAPCSQVSAPVRSNTYVENSAPNNMTSDARNSHMPSLALYRPVSGRSVVL